ncbi:hypothetical protein DH09_11495 [Bacillaceae bacterium JMAK1]|nr:hypothetical protein DH09_11495 [Bacillaceae bacterium JMAK1]
MKKVSNILGVLMVIFVIIDLTLFISGSSFSLFFTIPLIFGAFLLVQNIIGKKENTLSRGFIIFIIS